MPFFCFLCRFRLFKYIFAVACSCACLFDSASVKANVAHTLCVSHSRLGKIALLGEMNKIVPISPQRALSVSAGSDDVTVTLEGVSGEHIIFR